MTKLPVFLHNVLEWPEKVFLEPEIGKLALLNELGGQLPQGVHREERDVLPGAASNSVKMVAENLPDSGPLQPDTAHVVIRDLDYLREGEHAGLRGVRQLLE